MEIIYHIRDKDILAGRRFLRKVSPVIKRTKNTAIIIVALIPFVGFLLRGQFTIALVMQMLVELMILSSAYVILVMFFEPLLDRQAVAILKKNNGGGVLGEHKICLTEEMLIESTSVNESHQKWTGIGGIYENQDYILITIGNEQVHIIPKRAFVSSDAAKQFYNQARSYYEKSHDAV